MAAAGATSSWRWRPPAPSPTCRSAVCSPPAATAWMALRPPRARWWTAERWLAPPPSGATPPSALDRNDAWGFFEGLPDAIVTGPTGTNVADLVFVLAAGAVPDFLPAARSLAAPPADLSGRDTAPEGSDTVAAAKVGYTSSDDPAPVRGRPRRLRPVRPRVPGVSGRRALGEPPHAAPLPAGRGAGGGAPARCRLGRPRGAAAAWLPTGGRSPSTPCRAKSGRRCGRRGSSAPVCAGPIRGVPGVAPRLGACRVQP